MTQRRQHYAKRRFSCSLLKIYFLGFLVVSEPNLLSVLSFVLPLVYDITLAAICQKLNFTVDCGNINPWGFVQMCELNLQSVLAYL
jgi:hypothetical protein